MNFGDIYRRLKVGRSSELGGLAGDSLYAFVWQSSISAADFVQIVLVAHVLGITEYGRLALVTSFVVLVSQFLDVRVAWAATTFGSYPVVSRHWPSAAGVFRFSYLIDAATGIAAFLIVVALAPMVGPWLIGEEGAWLIILFGVSLLVSTVDDSSISVTRLLGGFRLLAGYTVLLEIFRIVAIGCALLLDQSLTAVVVALVVYEFACGLVNYAVAASLFARASGMRLVRWSLEGFRDQRAMLGTVMHTNVLSYARIAQVQFPTLLLGVVTTPASVGLYKIGVAAASLIGRVGDPASAAVLPRLSRLWAGGQLDEIRRLIRSATVTVVPLAALAFALLVILRDPVLRLLGGVEAVDAGPVLILAGLAQAANAGLFWNTGLLFAAGRSGAVSMIAIGTAVLQLALLFPLVAAYEETGAAIALLITVGLSNIVLVILCLRLFKNCSQTGFRDNGILSDNDPPDLSSEQKARA